METARSTHRLNLPFTARISDVVSGQLGVHWSPSRFEAHLLMITRLLLFILFIALAALLIASGYKLFEAGTSVWTQVLSIVLMAAGIASFIAGLVSLRSVTRAGRIISFGMFVIACAPSISSFLLKVAFATARLLVTRKVDGEWDWSLWLARVQELLGQPNLYGNVFVDVVLIFGGVVIIWLGIRSSESPSEPGNAPASEELVSETIEEIEIEMREGDVLRSRRTVTTRTYKRDS